MNEAISGGGDEEEPEDLQDKILAAMARRKMGNNASFFAFTATPKNTTLERFGRQNAEGKFLPFHLYSMKQAIEEQFILDVLRTTPTKATTSFKNPSRILNSIQERQEAAGLCRGPPRYNPKLRLLDHFAVVVRPKAEG